MADYTVPDFSRSALVIIDMQNDFVLPGAPACIEGSIDVLPNMVKLLSAYRRAGRPVVHIVRLYRRDGSNVDLCRRARIESGEEIAAPGTLGSQVVDALREPEMWELDHQALLEGHVQRVGDEEVVIYKPRWGAFYETPLHSYFQKNHVDTLVFYGCNFPNCPRTSIYEASERDYRVVMAGDAVSRVYDQGLRELRGIGVHIMETVEIANLVQSMKGNCVKTRREHEQ